MLMPAGSRYPGQTAGPCFGLTRHVMLPPDAGNALVLCRERFRELAALAGDLLPLALPDAAKNACRHLQEISGNFQT